MQHAADGYSRRGNFDGSPVHSMFLTLNVYGRLPRGSMNWPLVAVLNGTDDNAKKTERNERKNNNKGKQLHVR